MQFLVVTSLKVHGDATSLRFTPGLIKSKLRAEWFSQKDVLLQVWQEVNTLKKIRTFSMFVLSIIVKHFAICQKPKETGRISCGLIWMQICSLCIQSLAVSLRNLQKPHHKLTVCWGAELTSRLIHVYMGRGGRGGGNRNAWGFTTCVDVQTWD